MNRPSVKRDRQRSRRAERRAAEQAAARRRQRARRLRLVVLVLVGLAALVALALYLARGADRSLGVPGAELAAGVRLPMLAAEPAAGDPAIGAPAPQVSGYDPDGEPVTIGGGGRAQAISFLAHWCPHCQEELPEVVSWVEAGNLPEEVDLVAVSTQHDPARPNWPPDAWLEGEGWPAPVLVDGDGTAGEAYGLRGTPYWVFVDADGVVVERHAGRVPIEQLGASIAALAEG